ncbi:NlpC/p60-like transpeptidase-domain-containing protein [Aspergillus leporis]|uniref:NlpC/p60-like transpeptidase-domain-containing protein n=1 Tax=Aspergillus leporis TaxID=41062 RepID=A0A5N5WID4_9EURO|nr:NlpC/p60-like transpeptidase-domain-containing protein [Aspergillus leporis]
MLSYTGSGPYCYAHSLYMVLLASGYDPQSLPSSGFIECLTTMPFGKHFICLDTGPVSFFSNPYTNPDDGINMALKAMGWGCNNHRGGDAASALFALREAVVHGPVLAGPLNMGYLSYNPDYTALNGADHFLVVLAVDEDKGMVLLHDPAGYPAVLLPLEDFIEAWRGEGIEYINHPFVFRSHFRHVEDVSRADMVARTIGMLHDQIKNNAMFPGSSGGVSALRLTLEAVEDVLPSVVNDLAGFTFPLAARRYLDARDFLAEAGLVDATGIMEQQALLAGKAQYPAAHGNWKEVILVLEKFIDLEDQLTKSFEALA